jgi:hypothetical protein
MSYFDKKFIKERRPLWEHPNTRWVAIKEIIQHFDSCIDVDDISQHIESSFGRFLYRLSKCGFYKEDYERYRCVIVDAWNEAHNNHYNFLERIKQEDADLCSSMWLKHKLEDEIVESKSVNNNKSYCENKDAKMSSGSLDCKNNSPMNSPIVIASIILSLGAVITALILFFQPKPVQKKFQKLDNWRILNVETGEVKIANPTE